MTDTYGSAIRTLRKRTGLTMREAAAQLKVPALDFVAWSKMESDRLPPPPPWLQMLILVMLTDHAHLPDRDALDTWSRIIELGDAPFTPAPGIDPTTLYVCHRGESDEQRKARWDQALTEWNALSLVPS